MAEIAHLSDGEIGAAGALLARAFAADPILTHVLASAVRRRVALPAFFRSVLRSHLAPGEVYGAYAEGRLVGVAIWVPPAGADCAAGHPGSAARAAFDRALVTALFPGGARAMRRGFAAAAALHPTVPHWYLAFVGVAPELQGQGIGGTLLAPVLREADRCREMCYLETPFPATIPFYERLGFRAFLEACPFAGAPPVTTMLREPQARAD